MNKKVLLILFLVVGFIGASAQEIPEEFFLTSQLYDNNVSNAEITLSADKFTYRLGDSIHFIGYVTFFSQGQKVSISLFDSLGNLRSQINIPTSKDGTFEVQQDLPTTIPSGDYTIQAKYSPNGAPVQLPILIEKISIETLVNIPYGASLSESKVTYSPQIVIVEEGLPIVWTNNDETTHTVVSGRIGFNNRMFSVGIFDSGIISPDEKFKISLEEGEYIYFCRLHPWLIGSIFVNPLTQVIETSPDDKIPHTNIDLKDAYIGLVTNKEGFYQQGETVEIFGKVKILEPGGVSVKVYDPKQNLIFIDQIVPNQDKTFAFPIQLLGDKFDLDGVYRIMVQFGINENKAETTFKVAIPSLIDRNYRGFDTFLIGGIYYGIPHVDGKFDLDRIEARDYHPLISGSSLTELQNRAKELYPMGPFLVEKNYTGYDIIMYGEQFYALPSGNTNNTDLIKNALTNLVIEVGDVPFDITINPFSNTIYVTNFNASSVSVVDGKLNLVTDTIIVGEGPRGIAVNPYTNKLYVANFYSQTISVIDTSTNKEIQVINLEYSPFGVALNPDINTVYVTALPNLVIIIDGESNIIKEKIEVAGRPFGVAVNQNMGLTYITHRTDEISVVFGTKNLVSTVQVGKEPMAVAVDADKNMIYVANYGSDSVSVIDAITNEIISIIPVGNGPRDLSINHKNQILYVTNFLSNDIFVIDTVNNKVIKTLPIGEKSTSISTNQISNLIYVNSRPNLIYVINGSNNSQLEFTKARFIEDLKKEIDELSLQKSQLPPDLSPKMDALDVPDDLLIAIWLEREDLQSLFPEVKFGDLDNLRSWALTKGWEEDIRLAKLAPEQEILEASPQERDDTLLSLQLLVVTGAIGIGAYFGFRYLHGTKVIPQRTPI